MDLVIIETVGVGQSEVDIVKMQILHWLYLFLVSVMISKLSKRVFLKLAMYLLSIKADRDGCDRLNVEIEMMLDLDSREE